MTVTEARERVARGAALLDQHVPGWAAQIDVGKLSIAGTTCIAFQLGHKVGGYEGGSDAYLWTHRQIDMMGRGHKVGFFYPDGETNPAGAFALLQDAWIEAIADRIVAGDGERASGEVQEIRLADVPLA